MTKRQNTIITAKRQRRRPMIIQRGGAAVLSLRHFGVSRRNRRGLTLLELLLAMIITALVAGAIAGMLGAVSAGVGSRKDNRDIMVRAHASQSRLAAYFATARCVLASDPTSVTIWLNDSRESGSVHATEIRWLQFDALAGEVVVQYVDFPDNWTRTACELADIEYPASTDWASVLATYQTKGMISTRALVDNLASASVTMNKATPLTTRHVSFLLGFDTEQGIIQVQASGAIRDHITPAK
jgi:prepilin-type N-terminal cleavage/methylation domain-containing protein